MPELDKQGVPNLHSTMAPPQAVQSLDQMKDRLRALEEYVARPQLPQLDSRTLGTHFARGVSDILKAQGTKRSKSPDGAPETPVTEMVKAEGPDDNHKIFCWPLRRVYKNPNAKPEDYWADAK